MILFLFPILLFIFVTFTGFGDRLKWEVVMKQRTNQYTAFFDYIADADLSQLLFGYGGGWGGLSNIYTEMIYRFGFLGFLLYVISFFIGLVIVRKHIKYLFNFNSHDKYFLIWFWFTILTVALSNLFNMNLQLPYYSMNFTMIMMVFLYRTKTIST